MPGIIVWPLVSITVALDDDGGVVNGRRLVAVEQYPADEREPARRLRVRSARLRPEKHERDERGERGAWMSAAHDARVYTL